MPTQWSGTVEERVQRLELSGRRCDGNNRFCTRAAVESYDLYAADGQGNRKPDAERVTKKSCSYHRSQFVDNGMWVVAAQRELSRKPSGRPNPRHAGQVK